MARNSREVGGGAEYATVREVLRYDSVEEVVMVDLDRQACELCQQHLPEWNQVGLVGSPNKRCLAVCRQGCIKDPRLTVHYGDAKAFLENYQGKFDVIIIDVCDPIESGPGMFIVSLPSGVLSQVCVGCSLCDLYRRVL